MMKLLSQLGKSDLQGKKVLLRVDFNVAVSDGKISENYRIKSHIPSIKYLLDNGAIVALASHISDVSSFGEVRSQIESALGMNFGDNLILLENTRSNPGEETNDEVFAKGLSREYDIFVNDAFATAHRKHASTYGVAKFLPPYAGFLMESETKTLSEALEAPKDGKIVVLGGAKISTKLPVIKQFASKADKILIGGALANNFFKFDGEDIGKSKYDAKELDMLKGLDRSNLVLPSDKIISEDMILDIGPHSADNFASIISKAKMVIWNGPMGLFEKPDFMKATEVIARAIANLPNSIIGGGDTISAVNQLGLLDKFSYVSTGGGAMLEFLAGKRLPALEALGYYAD